MRNADKGGGAGSGESQKPPTVPELTQKVKDLEAEKLSLEGKVTEANTAKDNAIAAQQKAEGERDVANTAKDTAIAAQQKAEGEREQAVKDKTAAETAKADAVKDKEKAEADLKNTDERTEARLRELSAKNGGTLPPKQQGAGDHTVTDKPDDKTKTPVQRLASTIKIA